MARTKVLLTEDVLDLGEAGDVRVVAGGYARNFLFPRNMAILATKGALKQAEEIRRAGMIKRAKEREHAESQASMINDMKLLFETKAGDTNRLYGSVTVSDIADRLEQEVGFEINRRRIQMEHPIRELGLYRFTLRLMAEVDAEFQVAAVREGETWADAESREAARLAAIAKEEAAEAAAAAESEAAAARADKAATEVNEEADVDDEQDEYEEYEEYEEQ